VGQQFQNDAATLMRPCTGCNAWLTKRDQRKPMERLPSSMQLHWASIDTGILYRLHYYNRKLLSDAQQSLIHLLRDALRALAYIFEPTHYNQYDASSHFAAAILSTAALDNAGRCLAPHETPGSAAALLLSKLLSVCQLQ
jgi:hypothetical protein